MVFHVVDVLLDDVVALLRHPEGIITIYGRIPTQKAKPSLASIGLMIGNGVHILAERMVNLLGKLRNAHMRIAAR